MAVFSRLARAMSRYPLLTTSTQAGLLMGAGDVISQTMVEKKSLKQVDLIRTARFGMIGFILVGPILRSWYGILDRLIKTTSPAKSAIAKMAVDQGIFAPFFLCNFIALLGFLNGDGVEQIKRDIKQNYVDIMITNYKIWPAAQIINFWLIPLQHRVLFAQTIALFWNTYLSFKTNRKVDAPESESSERENILL